MGHYIRVRELPPSIQKALSAAGYGRDDIEVFVEEKFEPRPPSMDGRKGFIAACRLDDSEEFKITWGSFGGSNMFVKTIDDMNETIEIPKDIAFVSGMGSAGSGYPAMARIIIGPGNMNPSLLPAQTDVSERESKILKIVKSYKPAYRKEYFRDMKVTDAEIDSLVSRGYLKRNKIGAISITTEGRNSAAEGYL